MYTILFVCTANQCRSPVAEALLKKHIVATRRAYGAVIQPELATAGSKPAEADVEPWLIRSAGSWAQTGQPAHYKTLVAAREAGIDLQAHRACAVDDIRPLTFFQLIITMEQGHKEALRAEFPEIGAQTYRLSELVGEHYDVADPIGHSLNRHRLMIYQIDQLLQRGFPRLFELVAEYYSRPITSAPASMPATISAYSAF